MYDRFDKIMFGFLLVVVIGLVGVTGYAIYDSATAEYFNLRKDSWFCTASRTETYMQYNISLKISMPVTNEVCTQWSYKK